MFKLLLASFLISITAFADTPPPTQILDLKAGACSGFVKGSAGALSCQLVMAIADGGTGATTRSAALNNLLPSQSGASGKFIASDGTNASWAPMLFVPLSRNVSTTAPLLGGGSLSADLTLSLPLSDDSTDGYLSASDHASFKAKQPAGPYITGFSGDIVAVGPGNPSAVIVGIQTVPIAVTTPADGQVLTFNSGTGSWGPQTPSGGGGGGSVTDVTASSPLMSSGGTAPNISCNIASGVQNGCLSSSDWSTFNGKQNSITAGNLSAAGVDGISVTNGTGAVIGSGTALQQHVADSGHAGYLSAADWATFNGKQAGGTIPIINGGTGQVTATAAFNALAPAQASNSGKYLTTDGANSSWATVTAGVSSVSGTAPIISSGGATPAISIPQADGSTNGYLSSGDFANFNSKQAALTFGSVSTSTSGVSVGNGNSSTVGPNVTVNVQTASGSQPGLLSAADWTTFNSKEPAQTKGSISTSTTGVTVGSGASSTVGPNVTVNIQTATGAQPGLLSAADWTTFNAKQSALTFGDITSPDLSVTGGVGAVIGSGAALTLNTVTIAKGGSGQTTANAALNAFLPPQTGNTGKVLSTNGSNTSWIAVGAGTVTSVTASAPLLSSGGTTPDISMPVSTNSVDGYLSAADHTSFAAKQPAGSYITALTGDVIAAGPGSSAASVVKIQGTPVDATPPTAGQFLGFDGTNWLPTVSPGTPTGTPNFVSYYDPSGNLTSTPFLSIDTVAGGPVLSGTYAPPGAVNAIFQNIAWNVTPSADASADTQIALNSSINVNGPQNTGGFVAENLGLARNDLGDAGNITYRTQQMTLGDGTNVSTSQEINAISNNIDVRTNHTVHNDIYLLRNDLQIDTGSTTEGTARVFAGFVTVNGSANGVQLFNVGMNVNADLLNNQGMQVFNAGNNLAAKTEYFDGFNMNTQMASGAHVVNNVNSFTDDTHIYSGANVDGNLTSFASYVNLDAGSTVNGYQGLQISPNLNATMTGHGSFGIGYFPNIGGPADYANGIQSNLDLKSGAVIANGVEPLQASIHMESGSSASYVNSISVFPNIDSGSTLGDFHGIQIGPTINTNINNLQLGNLYFNGTGTVQNATGLNISMNNIVSPNPRVGLNIDSGSLNVNAAYDTTTLTPVGEFQLNGLGGQLTITSGHPVTGVLGFGNNIGIQSVFADDYGPDGFGGFLGFSNVGFVNQVVVATGKTVDTYSHLAVGGSVPDIGQGVGDITNYNGINLIGLINGGGAVNVVHAKGFRLASFFCAQVSGDCFGLHIADPAADNFVAKDLVIGGSTGLPVISTTALEIHGPTDMRNTQNGVIEAHPLEQTLTASTGSATTIAAFNWPSVAYSSVDVDYSMIEKSTGLVRRGKLTVTQQLASPFDVVYTDLIYSTFPSFPAVVLSAVDSSGMKIQFTNASANDILMETKITYYPINFGSL